MKYADPAVARCYSHVPDYPEVNQAAVKEMHRQVGDLVLDNDGIAVRGLLVRHLVLPNGLAGTEKVLEFLAREISTNTYVNLMDQYHPSYRADGIEPLSRPAQAFGVERGRASRREMRSLAARQTPPAPLIGNGPEG